MDFIGLNWWKLIFRVIANSLVIELIIVSLYEYNSSWQLTFQDIFNETGFAAPFTSVLFTVVYFFANLYTCDLLEKKIANGDKTIAGLFDNEQYSVGLCQAKNPYLYTQRCLKGYRSLYPMTISYQLIIRSSIRVNIDVYVVSPKDSSIQGMRKRVLTDRATVFKDVQREILEFTDELKRKGYSPAKQYS
jgi:hypothetical protein